MRRLRLIGVAVALAVLVLLVVSPLASSASGGSRNTKYQWDIINFDFATSTITAGGHASAFATGSGGSIHTGKITVTGHGTFRSNPGNPQDVTGGGTWQTFDGTGSPSGSGRYQVTGFVDFHVAPGSLPDSVTDNSGIKADVRSGLAVFQIAYDGDVLWDRKRDGGFPDAKTLKQRVRDRLDPARDLGHVDRTRDDAAPPS